MKIRKLSENYLDDLHKYNKKRQKGMSPFSYLNPNAGDVPKTIGRFNNSVDTSANVGMMGEAFEDEEIIKDDPEIIEEMKQDLLNLGRNIRFKYFTDWKGRPASLEVDDIDYEFDYNEETNEYYLVIYCETINGFSGEMFRSDFVPIMINIMKDLLNKFNLYLDFNVELNAYDKDGTSMAATTIHIDGPNRVKVIF